jgi:hypothetical protein
MVEACASQAAEETMNKASNTQGPIWMDPPMQRSGPSARALDVGLSAALALLWLASLARVVMALQSHETWQLDITLAGAMLLLLPGLAAGGVVRRLRSNRSSPTGKP